MDFQVTTWDDDFTDVKRKQYTNLKCRLPGGRIVPGLVPIVKSLIGIGVMSGDQMFGKMGDGYSVWRIWWNERVYYRLLTLDPPLLHPSVCRADAFAPAISMPPNMVGGLTTHTCTSNLDV